MCKYDLLAHLHELGKPLTIRQFSQHDEHTGLTGNVLQVEVDIELGGGMGGALGYGQQVFTGDVIHR